MTEIKENIKSKDDSGIVMLLPNPSVKPVIEESIERKERLFSLDVSISTDNIPELTNLISIDETVVELELGNKVFKLEFKEFSDEYTTNLIFSGHVPKISFLKTLYEGIDMDGQFIKALNFEQKVLEPFIYIEILKKILKNNDWNIKSE